ncbi:hypothetical protein J3B02_003380 [Coemansia erecta]|nr:hypothetical protein J3B02_003380 [Coemansia erecta]
MRGAAGSSNSSKHGLMHHSSSNRGTGSSSTNLLGISGGSSNVCNGASGSLSVARSASKSKLSTGAGGSSGHRIPEEEDDDNRAASHGRAGIKPLANTSSTGSSTATAVANVDATMALAERPSSQAVPPARLVPVAGTSSEKRVSTINESEWDDVPRAYQRRMRKVWKRDSTFQVMNEVVVDRGPSPYLSQIELYGDGNHLTTVEADGLCLATPTGSTAYSLAAGGSLVHPEIPAILVTPICAHTLSFRPMLLPDSMVLRVVLPPDSRNTAWASFDGRHRIELRRGDHIQITASKYPLPTVCASQSQTQDWMSSLSRCLNWNERKRQKKFSSVMGSSKVGEQDDLSDEGGNVGDEGSEPEDDDNDDDNDDEQEDVEEDSDALSFK